MLEERPFELVLLDSMMPGMTGIELLQLLRATKSAAELPVIMVTALSDSERVVEALSLGANDYITKPIDMPVALARINAQLVRKQSEDTLRGRDRQAALAARNGSEAMWDWDIEADTLQVSDRWTKIVGRRREESPKSSKDWFALIHADERIVFESRLRDYLEGASGEFVLECRMIHATGSLRWVQCSGTARRNIAGVATRMTGSLVDVTAARAQDSLTGLPNRTAFRERVALAVPGFERDRTAGFAIIFLGLDQFKFINDCMGHSAGDDLLVEVSRRLEASLRVDTGQAVFRKGHDVVARLGGDEFAVFLDRVLTEEAAVQVAERVRKELQAAMTIQGKEIFTAASLGVVCATPDHLLADEILRDAGTALHRAKTGGKNCTVVFDSQMRAEAVARMELESDLKKAIARGEFEAHYQPKIRLKDDQVIGFEALIRWNHPRRGLLMPGDFLQAAEETGLIVPMGLWIIRDACRTVQEWRKEFLWSPALEISVNVSMRQFRERDFADSVIAVLDEFNVEPGMLNLEITESVLMDDVAATLRVLDRMKARGVGFKIDDFGTGYSSLSYLQRLPFDSLKIDRSFVAEVDNVPGSMSIIETVISLARNLGLNIVAEGIETAAQAERLRAVGCDYGQGYLFAKPMSSAKAHEFLKNAKGAVRAT